jgi:hypothetical protein
VRLYLFALWLVLGVGVFLTSYNYTSGTHLGPVAFWVFGAATFVCIQFCISICERERWGPRMRRNIPQAAWKRLPAFLFFTGSAGGVAFSGLLGFLTLLSTWWWCEAFDSTTRGHDTALNMMMIMLVISMYTWCYGLSAVLVRAHVLAGQLKPAFTWLVGLLLVGLGSSIPAVIAMIFFSEQMRYNTDGGWWMLPNPFMAVYEFIPGFMSAANVDFQTLSLWFLGTWAVLVTVLCMPWFIAQMRHFRARHKRDVEFAPVMVVEATPSSVGAG